MKLYAIVEVNQASHQPEDLDGPYTDLRWAQEMARDMEAHNRARGRGERFYVAKLVAVES